MGLDLRMASQDHVKLAYAETMAPVMQFLMRAEDGDAVAGAVQLHQSAAAQHELADISGIPLEVLPHPATRSPESTKRWILHISHLLTYRRYTYCG